MEMMELMSLTNQKNSLVFDGIQWRDKAKKYLMSIEKFIKKIVIPNVSSEDDWNFMLNCYVTYFDNELNEIRKENFEDFFKRNSSFIKEMFLVKVSKDFDLITKI